MFELAVPNLQIQQNTVSSKDRTQDLLWSLFNIAKHICIESEVSKLSFNSWTTSLFGLQLFLESIGHDFIQFSKIQTDNQMTT